MSAVLTLDLPWLERSTGAIEGLEVRSGQTPQLEYEDGIVLDVRVVDPSSFTSASDAIAAAQAAAGPGRVVLVAGSVPLEWRAALRHAAVSFVDVSGVAEIAWPRLSLSARRFGQATKRHRAVLPMQKGHGPVAQELLAQSLAGSRSSIGELAASAGVSVPTASKAVSQLVGHGLAKKHRDGRRVEVEVVDVVTLARILAGATAWPGTETLSGYLWGRTIFDVAASLSSTADSEEVEVAVSGRVGAAYLGVLGTTAPAEVRAWVAAPSRTLVEIAEGLRLEPAPEGAANVTLSRDRWGIGVGRRQREVFDHLDAWIAHPLRIWCDLHSEQRGTEYGSQMWSVVSGG